LDTRDELLAHVLDATATRVKKPVGKIEQHAKLYMVAKYIEVDSGTSDYLLWTVKYSSFICNKFFIAILF